MTILKSILFNVQFNMSQLTAMIYATSFVVLFAHTNHYSSYNAALCSQLMNLPRTSSEPSDFVVLL